MTRYRVKRESLRSRVMTKGGGNKKEQKEVKNWRVLYVWHLNNIIGFNIHTPFTQQTAHNTQYTVHEIRHRSIDCAFR